MGLMWDQVLSSTSNCFFAVTFEKLHHNGKDVFASCERIKRAKHPMQTKLLDYTAHPLCVSGQCSGGDVSFYPGG